MKYLYCGKFNWYGEIHKLWTHAKNEAAANRQFMAKLSKILGTSKYRMRNYFAGTKDNFKISLINGGNEIEGW